MNARIVLFAFPMIIVGLLMGCSDPEAPVIPDPPRWGTIFVNPSPDSLNAPWILSLPDDSDTSGTGDLSLTGMTPGEYLLTWEPVSHWISPASSSHSLLADSTVAISGTYEKDFVPDMVLIPPSAETMPTSFVWEGYEGGVFHTREISLTGRFEMSRYEVTQDQYVELLQWAFDNGYVTVVPWVSVLDAMDGSTVDLGEIFTSGISFSDGTFSTVIGDHPYTFGTWFGAAAYCDWLSLRTGLPRAYDHSSWSCNNGDPYRATGFRLPTEAEWELACRAGTLTPFNTGDCLDSATEANFNGNYTWPPCPEGPHLGHPTEVGSYPPNSWDLYDMHGNVDEWCNDWYGAFDLNIETITDPTGSEPGSIRVRRGGSYEGSDGYCASSTRSYQTPYLGWRAGGFRPVKSVLTKTP